MGTILGISIPVILFSAAALALAGTIWYFYRKAKRTMKDLFGTDNLSELVKSREEEEANTPKSVSGMTSIYVPQIQKDFPELNWVELRGIAEGHLKKYLGEKGFSGVRIHKTEVLSYLKNAGTCVIVFQSGVQYHTGTKKIQTRFNTHMIYIQDAIEYGKDNGFSVTCPHCGGALTSLGAKFCEYCGSEVIPINIHVWNLHKIEEV